MAIEPGKAYFLVDTPIAAVDRTQPVFPTGDLYVSKDGIRVGAEVQPHPDWPTPKRNPWIIWTPTFMLMRWPERDNTNG